MLRRGLQHQLKLAMIFVVRGRDAIGLPAEYVSGVKTSPVCTYVTVEAKGDYPAAISDLSRRIWGGGPMEVALFPGSFIFVPQRFMPWIGQSS